ncbi:DUF4402 domain-containing protein [Sphingomonas lacunae]|uniref:DUF4402 domain-containing protein n=2 Tax=Sphingomonas lacunae TaxID=2698828 RepID=A0A6M4AUU0_9SPHN|nr:DUF4402 domain-containing protein [Sphingomonas lacunae]
MGTSLLPFMRHVSMSISAAMASVFVPFALAAPAQAQTAGDSEAARSEAIILRPLSFFRVQDLEFGDFVPGATGGVVRVLPNGTRTATGSITLVGANHQPARFAGLGTFNRQVDISVSANSIQLTGPGAPMTLSQFEIGSTPTAILTTTPLRFRIASTTGIFNFPIGGRLAVNANQAAGTYAGTFVITLNYL